MFFNVSGTVFLLCADSGFLYSSLLWRHSSGGMIPPKGGESPPYGYGKLNQAEKKELYEWQQHNKNQKDETKKENTTSHTISALQQQVQDLTDLIKSKSDDGSAANANATNSDHPALKRVKFSQRHSDE